MLLVAGLLALTAPAEAAPLEVEVLDTGLGRVTSQPSGIDCTVGECTSDFAAGSVVTLRAAPAPGYAFGDPDENGYPVNQSGWQGDECTPAQADPLACSITVPADGASVDARFRPAAVLLLVVNSAEFDDEVTATITSPQVGETDELTCSGEPEGGEVCAFAYLPGRAVTLTPSPLATPFLFWSDDDCVDVLPCTIVLDELRRSVTATFATQRVSVRVYGTGVVASDPSGIACPDECGAEFPTGQVVTLVASGDDPEWLPPDPNEPARAGCDSGSGAVCDVIAERARWAVVSFGDAQPPDPPDVPPRISARLRIRKLGGGSGTVRGGGIDCGSRCAVERDYGDRVELVADAASGSRFVRWRRGCGDRARCSVTVGPVTRMSAEFEPVARNTAVQQEPPPTRAELAARMDRVRARRIGRRRFQIVLPLRVNLAATVTARVTRRGRTVFRRTWQLAAGERRLRMRVRARRGRYRLVVAVRTSDGQVVRITRRLLLRR